MINLLVLELSNLIGPLIHEEKFLLQNIASIEGFILGNYN